MQVKTRRDQRAVYKPVLHGPVEPVIGRQQTCVTLQVKTVRKKRQALLKRNMQGLGAGAELKTEGVGGELESYGMPYDGALCVRFERSADQDLKA